MIQKTRVMLYVNDVEMICRFFVEKIGAEIFRNDRIARRI